MKDIMEKKLISSLTLCVFKHSEYQLDRFALFLEDMIDKWCAENKLNKEQKIQGLGALTSCLNFIWQSILAYAIRF